MLMRVVQSATPIDRVGIDISDGKFDACIRRESGKHKAEFKINRSGADQFRQWLKKHAIDHPELWMEATGRYFEELAEWAVKRDWKVVVANPRCVRQFAISKLKISKSDPLDAETVLCFAERSTDEDFRFWQPRSAARKELRDLQLSVKGLKKEIGQERNRLKCGLQSEFTKNAIRQTISFLQSQVKKLHKESMRIIRSDAELVRDYRSLKSIKGFGDVTVAFVLAKIDFDAFRKGRQLVKYAGLDTVQWQSGKSIRKRERISRVGHADLRSAIFLPAVVAITHDPEMRDFAEKLSSRGACNKVIICAVMAKLLRIAFARVRDGKRALQDHAAA